MKPINDYYDFYLKYHVSLLADLFEKFTNVSLKNYLSTLDLSGDTMLRMTKV